MVDHKSTGLPECAPTESSAPEPCYYYYFFRLSLMKNKRKLSDEMLWFVARKETILPFQDGS